MRNHTPSFLASVLAVALTSPALAADVDSITDALDIPADAVVSATTAGLYDQSSVVGSLGPIAAPEGDMVLFSTGYAGQVQSGVDHDLGTGGFDPTEPGAPVHDQALLEMTLTVPEGMHSIKFDWYFLSREYPYYVNSDFNDRFTVVQTGDLFEGNIVFDDAGSVVDVNNALFTVTDALSLEGTGYWRASDVSPSGFDGGGTGWVTTQSPVAPGETVHLRFDVHDVADGVYDSGVLVDHFRWSEEEVDDPKSGAPLELHWLSPKSASVDGGDTVLISGRRFTADTVVTIGGVEATDVQLVADHLLSVTVPAGDAPGLVDVLASTDSHEASLEGGFTWVTRGEGGAPPEVTSVEPEFAPADGGAELVLSGVGLSDAVTVLFGDVAATDVESISGSELRVTLPELEPGAFAVRVVDAAGRTGGRPVPFVARGKLADPSDRVAPVPGGCSAAGGSPAGPGSLLLLLGLVVIFRWRRYDVVSLVAGLAVATALTGCNSDHTLRPGAHGHPVASAAIVDGDTEVTSATVAVGAPVELTGERSVGSDGARLDWNWTVVEAPTDVELGATADRGRRVAFTPDVPGTYLLQLVVSDHRGRSSHPDAVLIHATDGGALRVRLEWDDSGHDLDLHLLAADGEYFAEGDCFFGRPQPAWGDVDLGEDDPRLLQDADGTADQLLREEIQLAAPADGTYTVLVHHLNDRGSTAEVEATVRVWRDGEEVALPLDPMGLVQGEVWQVLAISVPGGEAAIDQVTTHGALGGPVLNRSIHDEQSGE